MTVGSRVLFLNFARAASGTLGNLSLPEDYVLACRFLRCSILDRTNSLPHGFDHAVLDPIALDASTGLSFADLCEERACELVCRATTQGKEICVLWSGGIDSTAALIAITRAAREAGILDQVVVVLSQDSVHENPRFFLDHVVGRLRVRASTHPIALGLDTGSINVTGEHGDQLFGSHLLESYVRRGVANVAYPDILPLVLFERLRSVRGARRVRRYLQPVVDAAPIPIRSLFDYLWWMNFALKWQEVALRIPAWRTDDARVTYESIHHFYRTEPFQAWALTHASSRRPTVWAEYKAEAKQYIHACAPDTAYLQNKEKEDSLRNVMGRAFQQLEVRMIMREDFQPVHELVEV